MPTYEYVCKDCGHHLSAEQRMSDPRLTDCPHCGKRDWSGNSAPAASP